MRDFEKFKKMFLTLQKDRDEEFGEKSSPIFEVDADDSRIWLIDSEILIEFDREGKFVEINFKEEA
jgi:hypothetical protein